mmetsp:Transcript_53436/g.84794  ORF Transcript_53436/g.84794 Transcript_53436/m.84794 type:complete len:634 (+) Transcript_53436:71-1972(+)
MPTVSVFEDALKEALKGKVDITEETFAELCFDFGLELDEVTSEKEMASKERGADAAKDLSERVIFKVDVPANRYDLLCLEGLVRALKVFKNLIPVPVYSLSMPKPLPQMKLTVHASTAQIRPFCVAAILRNVTFDKERYDSFIELQDKLHQNICRKRSLVAIGTHDLSTLKPPFRYEALPPKDIRFVPLREEEEMDGNRLMEVLSQHQQLKAYLPLIRDSPVYPVIYDSNDVVLSLPPIINGEHSKIRLETKDVFIECTATDLTKAKITLNTVVAMCSEHCKIPFVVEPVEVVYADDYPGNAFTKAGDKIIYPQLDTREMKADIDRMRKSLSLEHLSSTEVRDLIRKMSISCEVDKKDNNTLVVQVPVTRSDIMHECDLIEDMAIAYGYNELHTEVPQTYGGASEQPVNHLTDLLRVSIANAGWTEAYNWALISKKENFDFLRREAMTEELWRPVARPYEYMTNAPPARLGNAKTKEFEIVRTTLLAGVLKCLASNKQLPLPIKIFEIGDIVVQDPTMEVGARNVRRICAIHAGQTAEFAKLHGLLDQIMFQLKCEPEHMKKDNPSSKNRGWILSPSQDPAFFPGRQAHIVIEGINIGVIGELHPEVVSSKGFDINMAVSAFEFNMEPFLEWL